MDVKTRWNATFKMLQVALKFKTVFDRIADECLPYVQFFKEKVKSKKGEREKNRVGPPVEEDWMKAKSFVHFLIIFYESTLTLNATKACTSHLLFPSIMAIQLELELQANDFTYLTLNRVAISMQEKFDNYWNLEDVNPLVFIANVLDPRSKFEMIRVFLEEIGWSSTRVETLVNKTKASLKCLWLEYKGERSTVSVIANGAHGGGGMQADGELNSVVVGADSTKTSKLIGRMYGILKRRHKNEASVVTNEVDKYLAEMVECTYEDDDDFNLLEWWKGSETRYPILSKITKDVLAIPSSTVANGSAFSLEKRIVDPFRSSLSPKTVEALVCASDWRRADEFSFYKDPTDDDLELYRELEEIKASAAQTQASLVTL